MGNIVVVGSSNTDLVVTTLHLPQPGETLLGNEINIHPGGKGANQVVATARANAIIMYSFFIFHLVLFGALIPPCRLKSIKILPGGSKPGSDDST